MSGIQKFRLDRLLANLGYGTRRTVQNLVNNGLVALDGKILRKSEERIALTADLPARLTVNAEPLDPLPGRLHVLMHKPLGATCSHKEEGALVYDLLPERWRARNPVLSTVGRLDKDTSGLLLLTDDGTILRKITAPKRAITKKYRFELDRPLSGREATVFAAGDLLLEGEDKPLLPAKVSVETPKTGVLEISEGRYHQVRRMFAAVGNHVVSLHRESIGGLALPAELAPGEYRLLSPAEIERVFQA
jgi:16S rRNA pseudouridine516 synthase